MSFIVHTINQIDGPKSQCEYRVINSHAGVGLSLFRCPLPHIHFFEVGIVASVFCQSSYHHKIMLESCFDFLAKDPSLRSRT